MARIGIVKVSFNRSAGDAGYRPVTPAGAGVTGQIPNVSAETRRNCVGRSGNARRLRRPVGRSAGSSLRHLPISHDRKSSFPALTYI